MVCYLSGLTCTYGNVTEKGEYRAACAGVGLAADYRMWSCAVEESPALVAGSFPAGMPLQCSTGHPCAAMAR